MKRLWKKSNICLRAITTLATLAVANAAAAEGIDLLGIFDLAQRNDPTYIAAQYDRDAVNEAQPQALARLLPSADLAGTANVTRRNFKEPTDGRDTFLDQSITLTVTQPVYRRELFVALKQSKASVVQAEVDYAFSLQDLMIRAATAYFNVLNAQDNVAFASANRDAIAQQLKQAKQRFEVGLIAITGVEEAKARFDLARSSEILAKNQRDNAREALREITGNYHPTLAQLRDETPLSLPEPSNIDAWTGLALRQNLEISSANYNVDIARHEIQQARSGHYPTLDLVGRVSRTHSAGGTVTGTHTDTADAAIGLQLNVPLYRGGRIVSETREARARYQQSLRQFEVVRRSVERQTRESFLGVQAGIAQVQALKQALVSNQAALDAIRAGFQVGTRTSVDVLDAQSDLFSAELDYAEARYDYILDILNLKKAAGTLTESDLAIVNDWLMQ
ncbi:MAG: TolC family outer membrane protein [Gammaproteobacteria bacterium]|nr:TolC family outer membrane protein [Gammaproteobacteria bacterium]